MMGNRESTRIRGRPSAGAFHAPSRLAITNFPLPFCNIRRIGWAHPTAGRRRECARPIQRDSQRFRTEPRTCRPHCDQVHMPSSHGIITIVIYRRPCAWVTSCAALLMVNAVVLVRHDAKAYIVLWAWQRAPYRFGSAAHMDSLTQPPSPQPRYVTNDPRE